MAYFIVQVKTGYEQEFSAETNKKLDCEQTQLMFLQRKLFIRKKGKKKEVITALFPGYVFLKSNTDHINLHDAVLIRQVTGFIRYLKSTAEPTAVSGADLDVLSHFLSFGTTVNASKAYFDSNDRIVITEGPLKGLEGNIVKVDKRKGRAKIHLDMYDEAFLIDLAFETIGKQEMPQEKNEE